MSKAQLDEAEKLIKSGTFELEYDVEHELGRGRFAIVKLCVHKQTKKKYAAKVVKKSRSNTHGRSGREQLLMEISILNRSTHPKMVRLYDVFETRTELQIILEFAEGGDLHRHCIESDIARTEKEICYLIRQILEATRYLHNEKIVHLDLKPDNILLAKKCEVFPEIRLIDFGLSRSLEGPYSQFDIVGTAEYVSPEVLAFDPIDYGSDMWSIGVVAYVLLSGISPFAGDDVMETYANIGCVDYDFDCEEFDEISDSAIDFIEKLLLRDPKKRMSAREALEHDWIKQLDGGVSTEDVIQAQQAKKEVLPEDLEICPLQADEGFASSSESDKSDTDSDSEDEKVGEDIPSKESENIIVNDEEIKSKEISSHVKTTEDLPPSSKKEEEEEEEIIKANEESNKIIDCAKEVGTDTSKKSSAPTSKEINGNLANRCGPTPKSAISDKMAKLSKAQERMKPSKSFDTGFLFKDKKTNVKSNLVKSAVTTSSEDVISPTSDKTCINTSPEIRRQSRDDNVTAGKKIEASLDKTENKSFTSAKTSSKSSEEIDVPIPDDKLSVKDSREIKTKSLDHDSSAEKEEVESSGNTTDNNTQATEKLDNVKDVDKPLHNNKKSPVPVPLKKPHGEGTKPSPPEVKVKPGGQGSKTTKKFGKPEATTKPDKKTNDSDELMSNVLFKMKSQTIDDSDEEKNSSVTARSPTSSILIEEPVEEGSNVEDSKPANSKSKSPPPVACKPKSPVSGNKKDGTFVAECKSESPPMSREDSPTERRDAKILESPTISPSPEHTIEVSMEQDTTKQGASPTLKRESPIQRNVEDNSEIGKTAKSPPPSVASKPPRSRMPKKPPEIATKPSRRKQSELKDVPEADQTVTDPKVKDEEAKPNETEHTPVSTEAVEPTKTTSPAKVGGGLKFSLNIGGGSKKLNIGPLVSVGDQERKQIIKQVSLTKDDPKPEVNEERESKPLVVVGNCERITETPDTSELTVRPSLADTRGKSDSFQRRRSNVPGDDSSHRKTYRRLYVTKVRNSKVYEHDFDITQPSTEAAKIAQRVDKDVLQVEVKLKCTDLKLLP